jgi:hypothetical protein
MLIKSLEQMEKIVANNRSLSWDGWTVINTYPSKAGWTSPHGILIKGVWHMRKRYEVESTGWEIPDKLVR